jgi:quercetin dioxygenase-like cupin family protein
MFSGLDLTPRIRSAQIVAPCADLAAALELFTGRLGFRLELIFPADAPTTAVISGHGVTLRLKTAKAEEAPPLLRLECDLSAWPADAPLEFTAPGGLRVELSEAETPLILPPIEHEFVISRAGDAAAWQTGRAGMEYRDLIPQRLGGRFVASHIRIPQGGPVPDYVHFHKIHFQMIYCLKGWARLVYEDQGPPFVMKAGDCVLQPPEIRHRVLEASDGFEVVEIGCPAIHETRVDHEMTLPNDKINPSRLFQGQRFAHHIARKAQWQTSPASGFEYRDTGLAQATSGLASARVIRATQPSATISYNHTGEFLFLFALRGSFTLAAAARNQHHLHTQDSCVLPAGLSYLNTGSATEILEISLPAQTLSPQTLPNRSA